MSQDTTLLHVYGYPRDGRRYFVGNPCTVDEGIQLAEVKNIRTLDVLWTSAPVLRPTGVR